VADLLRASVLARFLPVMPIKRSGQFHAQIPAQLERNQLSKSTQSPITP
jgi:hypothetical protein